ncbi:UNVERIFIED_CONTAM: hypothetical protein RMT77_011581 [Armadillidium vulgare]
MFANRRFLILFCFLVFFVIVTIFLIGDIFNYKIDFETQENANVNLVQKLSEDEELLFETTEENETEISTCKNKIKLFTPKRMDTKYDEQVIRRHPNLPHFLINGSRLMNLIPPIYKIRWSGLLYQESWESYPKCLLYSANFDARMQTGPVVRILGLCEEISQEINLFCQFWYNETQNPEITSVYEMYFPGQFVGNDVVLKARMISCKVPKDNDLKIPIAVSIVRDPCTAPTNILKIGGSLSHKEKTKEMSGKNITIGLCGKSIFYYNEDYSLQLIEWIEILNRLGISTFFLYKTLCHKNVEKVLDYYEKKGLVKIIDFHFPNPFIQEGTFLRDWIHTHFAQFNGAQRMFYNDCILKNKDNFDYLAIFDYDEIPILRKHKNLFQLIDYFKKEVKGSDSAASFGLGWKFMYKNLESTESKIENKSELYFLRHELRTPLNISAKFESNVKSIYDTDKVLFVACHSLIHHNAVPPLSVKSVSVKRDIAFTGHFKNRSCDSECSKTVEEETVLLQYETEIKKAMERIRQEIGL